VDDSVTEMDGLGVSVMDVELDAVSEAQAVP